MQIYIYVLSRNVLIIFNKFIFAITSHRWDYTQTFIHYIYTFTHSYGYLKWPKIQSGVLSALIPLNHSILEDEINTEPIQSYFILPTILIRTSSSFGFHSLWFEEHFLHFWYVNVWMEYVSLGWKFITFTKEM